MSAFADRCYIDLVHANGGMGAVAPMKRSVAVVEVLAQLDASRGAQLLNCEACPACLDKQKTPASATNTPEVMTNIRTRNDDGTNCRS